MEPTKENTPQLNEESVQRRTKLFNLYVLPHLNLVYKLCINYSYSQEDIADNYIEVLTNFYKYIDSYDSSLLYTNLVTYSYQTAHCRSKYS